MTKTSTKHYEGHVIRITTRGKEHYLDEEFKLNNLAQRVQRLEAFGTSS